MLILHFQIIGITLVACVLIICLIKMLFFFSGKSFLIKDHLDMILFFDYLACVYALIAFPLPTSPSDFLNPSEPPYVLQPFDFVTRIREVIDFDWQDWHSYIGWIEEDVATQPLANVLMMIPFGMFLRKLFQRSLLQTILLTFSFSLFLELTQLTGFYFVFPRPYRLFEVDDLLMNTLGGSIGYVMMNLISRRTSLEVQTSRRSL